MEVKPKELIDGKIYYIESYGPNNIITKMKGVFRSDVMPLLRFDDVTYEPNKNNKTIGIIHSPETINSKNHWKHKYFEY
mgnify:CR=1 FL=1|jgi:hypothetical protein|tara:strand:+ start:964 stop:1200 length:237 start_codon:yes stop_codon:yes gene_type:complete